MSGSMLALVVGLTALVGVVYLWEPLRAWRRYRGEHLVTCPETKAPAAVSIDLGRATFTALVEGRADVHLGSCSRWHERGRCDEPCVCQVEATGTASAVTSLVADWCESKRCVYCARPITASGSRERPAALLGPDAISVSWRDVPAEHLPSMFVTHQPICWSCHHAESFVRAHKELVVER